MSTGRLFAYNPTHTVISGAEIKGNLSIQTGVINNFGSLQWYMGPDEDLIGWYIASDYQSSRPQFWAPPTDDEAGLLFLLKRNWGIDFPNAYSGYTWLNDNGYWMNFTISQPTTTTTTTTTTNIILNAYYFSSSTGDDSNDGLSENNPKKTLTELNSLSLSPGDTILLKSGDSFEGTITVGQSGTSGATITYGSYGSGEKPKIYGSEIITGWTLHSGNIYKKVLTTDINQLFINGIRPTTARYPKTDYAAITTVNSTTQFISTGITSQSSDYYKDVTIILRDTPWSISSRTITASSGQTITINSAPAGTLKENWGFYMVGKLEFLTQAGEWYYDTVSNTVYLWTISGDTPDNYEVRGSVNQYGINVVAKDYIKIENIDIREQSTYGVYINGSDNVTIDNCNLQDISNTAVLIDSGAFSATVKNTTINNIQTYGIRCYGDDNIIENNIFTNIGLINNINQNGYFYGNAIYHSTGNNCLIKGNVIDNIGYIGIRFDEGATYTTIENNVVKNTLLSLADGAGIYSWVYSDLSQPVTGSIIRNNYVENAIGNVSGVYGSEANIMGAYGIYLDDRTSDVSVYNNTVNTVADYGLFLHNNKRIVVYDNTFYNTGRGHVLTHFDGGSFYAEDLEVYNNIFYNIPTSPSVNGIPARLAAIDNNAIFPLATVNNNTYVDRTRTSPFRTAALGNINFSDWKTASSWDSTSINYTTALATDETQQLFVNTTSTSKTYYINNSNARDISGNTISTSFTLNSFESKIIEGLNLDCILDYSDSTAPIITVFTLLEETPSFTITPLSISATGEATLFKITETNVEPTLESDNWSPNPTYTSTVNGNVTLYAWARDAAGNISESVSGTTNITASYVNIGNETLYGLTSTTSNSIRAYPVTMSENGYFTSISIYHSAGNGSDLAIGGIYSDDGANHPDTLLGTTEQTILSTNTGWETINFKTPIFVTSGTTVWIAWNKYGTCSFYYQSGSVTRASKSATFGELPSTFGTADDYTNYSYSIYCTYIHTPTSYYFSMTGNDSNDGLTELTPKQTITELNSLTLVPGDSVLFKSGDSFEGTITVGQSGTSGVTITYGSYGTGNNPKIYGSEIITGWTLHSGNIYKATVGSEVTQLFVNDEKMQVSRFPSTGYATVDSAPSTSSLTDASLNDSIDYTGAICLIHSGSYAFDRRTVTSSTGTTLQLNSTPFGNVNTGEKYVLIGKLEFLTVSGQWYYDDITNTVYLWKLDNSEPSNTEVRGSTLTHGIDLNAKNYITVQNLEVIQYKNTGILLTGSDYCSIKNNTIKYCEQNSIFAAGTAPITNTTIENNTVIGSNNMGIEIFGSNNIIYNNNVSNIALLDNLGILGTGSWYMGSGIYVEGDDNLIDENRVDEIGYNGIQFHHRNVVTHNYITNTIRTKSDGGAIYTSAAVDYLNEDNKNSIIRYNTIQYTWGLDNIAEGIYLDESSGGVTVEFNTISNTNNIGIFAHKGNNHVIRYNTIYLSDKGYSQKSDNRDIIFTNNIIYRPTERVILDYINLGNSVINNNIYVSTLAHPFNKYENSIDNYWTFPQWKTNTGQDSGTTYNNLALETGYESKLFINPTNTQITYYLNNASNCINAISGDTITDNFIVSPYSSIIIEGENLDCILDYSDSTAPVITDFSTVSASTTNNISILSFNVTGATKYIITESNTTPLLNNDGWSSTIPTTYNTSSGGTITLYAWARDAAGNISSSMSDTVIVDEPTVPSKIGTTSILTSSTTTANAQRAYPVTMDEFSLITSISFYHSAGNGTEKIIGGIYSDDGDNHPDTLLATTLQTVATTSLGWQTIDLVTPIYVTSGTTIWISWNKNGSCEFYYDSGSVTRANKAVTFGDLPSSFGTADSYINYSYSIYLNYLKYTPSYYFSMTGDDSNDGLSELTPKKTIDELNSLTLVPGDYVAFKAGDSFDGTITVGQSGTSGATITYGSYGTGNNPKIYGSEVITGWTLHSGNIYKATVGSEVTQLFVDGVKMKLARYSENYQTITTVNSQTNFTCSGVTSQVTDYYKDCVVLLRTENYFSVMKTVVSSSGNTFTISSAPSGTIDVGEGILIFNKLDFLTASSEWYYDSGTTIVYLWTPNGDSPSNYEVRISTLQNGINLGVSNYINIENLEILQQKEKGINISGSGNSIGVTIKNNYIHGQDMHGIYGQPSDIQNLLISGNTISNCNESGIQLRNIGNSTVTDNIVHSIGLINEQSKQGTGIYGNGSGISVINASSSGKNIITYNKIYDINYNGIRFAYLNDVKYNHIINSLLHKGDGGAIYTELGAGSNISYNIIEDVIGSNEGRTSTYVFGNGIYTDEVASGITVEHNTIMGCSHAAIYTNRVVDCLYQYNTTYNSRYGIFKTNHSGTVISDIKNNLFIVGSESDSYEPRQLMSYYVDGNAFFDNNKYVNGFTSDLVFRGTDGGYKDFTTWKTNISGDTNSSYNGTNLGVNESQRIVFNDSKLIKNYYLNSASGVTDEDGISVTGFTLQPYTSKYVRGINIDCILDYEDSVAPTVTVFTIPDTSENLTTNILSFIGSTGTTKYLITETSDTPTLLTPGWYSTPPATYTFTTEGTKTLYAWVRDAAGNISSSSNASVVVTISFDLIPNIVSWHEGNNASGTTVTDSKGGSSGTLYAGALTGQTGNLGNAILFDGTDDYMYIPRNTSIFAAGMPEDFSVLVRFKLVTTGATSVRIFESSYGTTDFINFTSTSANGLIATMAKNNSRKSFNTTSAISTSTWYVAVVTWNATTEVFKFYLNSTLITNSTYNFGVNGGHASMAIGRRLLEPIYTNMLFETLGIFDKVLTQEEVSWLQNREYSDL